MKNLHLSLLAAVIITGIALLSCNSDPCEKVSCKNGGVATASADNKSCPCKCVTGYIGDSCEATLLSTLTAKVWSATRVKNDTAKATPYSVYFSADGSSITNIKIQNIGNYSCNPGGTDVFSKAMIKSGTMIEFDTTAQCGYSFIGSGAKQADGSWIFTYNVKYGNQTDKVVTTLR